MAFEVFQVPSNKFNMAQSPIVVVAGDTDQNNDNYRVVVKVKVWTGLDSDGATTDPIVTLDKVQNADGVAVFDIGPIIEDVFVMPEPYNLLDSVLEGTGMVFNMSLDIGYDENNGQGFQAVLGTNTQKVMPGYAYYPQDINDFEDSSTLQLSRGFLTVRPNNETFVVDEPITFWVMWQGTGTSQGRRVLVEGTKNTGTSFSDTKVLNDIPSADPPDNAADFVLGVNYTSIFWDVENADLNKPVTIKLQNADGTTTYQTKNVKFKEALCDVGSDTIIFINRFGVYDFIHIYAVQRQGEDVEKEYFERRIGELDSNNDLTYKNWEPSKKAYRVRSTRTYLVNTGWITEDWNDLLKDMLRSKWYYSVNLGVALNLLTSEFTDKRDADSNRVQYEFRFEVANQTIQNIV